MKKGEFKIGDIIEIQFDIKYQAPPRIGIVYKVVFFGPEDNLQMTHIKELNGKSSQWAYGPNLKLICENPTKLELAIYGL